MTTFTPQGPSVVLTYADDSTETSVLAGGATNWLVFNPDAANVVVVSFGFTDGDTDAVVPTSGANGKGTVIGPGQQVTLTIPQAGYVTPMYISVAGVSATGNVYISVGSIQ
jgi:hypothetical protein